jgi:hypothetical protein
MMAVLGYAIVFLLGGFVQFLWLSQGQRNTAFSALLLMAVAVGGVVILGWAAIGALIVGMILGPVLARQRS